MRRVLRQRLPGETRIAVIEADALVELHLLRDHDVLTLGSPHEAITRERVGGRWRADVAGENVWLLGHLGGHHGSRIPVRVIRAPIPEPGQIKPAHVMELRDAASVQLLPWPDAVDVAAFPDSLEVEALLDQAETGLFPFAQGLLSLERTRAGTIIDIDGHGDPLDINQRAATLIARLLRLYGIGGMVVIDFLGLDNRLQRQTLDNHFHAQLLTDPRPFERTAMNGFGLVQVVRARPAPSVIDRVCGTLRNRACIDTLALKLLAEALRSSGAGARTLTGPPLVIARLKDWPATVAELAQQLGAPVQLVADPQQTSYGHVHVRPV